jgi:PKD repeat protein
MAVPVAHFIIGINGREISFQDVSLNVPTSWLWYFGDGQNDSVRNPIHTYGSDGFYSVSFKATNGDGYNTIIQQIGVSQYGPMLNKSILEIVQNQIPISITITVNTIQELIQKWQLYLFSLVTPAIDSVNIYNEFAYPALVNQLIAYLVIYDIIINGANSYLLSISQGTSGIGVQEVKKITTGPSDVEWFAGSASWSDIFSKEGLFSGIKDQLCSIASTLGYYLYMCPKPGLPVKAPKVFYPDRHCPEGNTFNEHHHSN